jgi:prophage regulatory protein
MVSTSQLTNPPFASSIDEARALIRPRQVQEAMGWSRSTLYEKINLGLFPRPVKLDSDGRAVGWPEREIAAYQKARIETRGCGENTSTAARGGRK